MGDDLAARRLRLGRLLRTIRRERDLTQTQLSELTGMPQSVISKSENGERQVEFVEVEAVCRVMEVSMLTFCRRWVSPVEDWETD